MMLSLSEKFGASCAVFKRTPVGQNHPIYSVRPSGVPSVGCRPSRPFQWPVLRVLTVGVAYSSLATSPKGLDIALLRFVRLRVTTT
jgi:hypothetical protein